MQGGVVSTLRDLFDDVADQMRLDMRSARTASDHPTHRGDALEHAFRTFLKKYLPNSLDVSHGVLIDSEGRRSKQLDVIVSDAGRTPIFFQSGEIRVIPVECAYAVFEVKSHLDGRELQRVFANLESVKQLRKKAYYYDKNARVKTRRNAYGRSWDILPVHYFAFALSSIGLAPIGGAMIKYAIEKQARPWDRLASVCVLDKGVICNVTTAGEFDALPDLTSDLNMTETSRSLLLFYTLIAHHLFQASMPPMQVAPYLGDMEFGGPDDTG